MLRERRRLLFALFLMTTTVVSLRRGFFFHVSDLVETTSTSHRAYEHDTPMHTARSESLDEDEIHFISHIPKAGGKFLMNALNRLFQESNDDHWHVCNFATFPLSKALAKRHSRKHNCTVIMTEDVWQALPNDKRMTVYTTLRDAREHVLSQFFHCTEGLKSASREHVMPRNLTYWLEAWVNTPSSSSAKDGSTGTRDDRFMCYDPRNSQTVFTGASADNDDSIVLSLKERYGVIGITSDMVRSTCLMYTHMTGQVAPACDCSSSPVRAIRIRSTSRRSSSDSSFSHGVTHHGASYKTTPYQDALIRQLRDTDARLYNQGASLFQDAIVELERQHNRTLCTSSFRWQT